MFMGTYNNSIDAKNRMIVPAKLRSQLKGDKCVITVGLDSCLCIYSMEDWERLVQKFMGIPEADPEARASIRAVFGQAQECDLDSQGRIVIPEQLKAHAGIKKELVTIGVLTKIEIWSKEVLNSPENNGAIDAKAGAEALLRYGF
ncbi:MAG: division/cell wall cluster transcriptional repressor MraZ [Firmicutes bacterium]|nr:division/cell wall cluster transcriptional repressor MraZ [Bacillota bacterium]